MDAYIYCAALYCEGCARGIIFEKIEKALKSRPGKTLTIEDKDAEDFLTLAQEIFGYKSESDYDSGDLPKGPYSDGGGESDTPDHCASCQTFLKNALTQDGYFYVHDLIEQYISDQRGSAHVLREWAEFYDGEDAVLDRTIGKWKACKPQDWR